MDGGALQWKYNKGLEDKTAAEVEAMSIDDINQIEEDAIKDNAWQVCNEVTKRIHMEPGPAGDLMLAMTDQPLSQHFFSNTRYLQDFHKSGKEKRKSLPGYYYFQKILKFMEDHTDKGELYMEVRIGHCTRDGYNPCPFCEKFQPFTKPSPRPFPDYTALPKYRYCDLKNTPITDRTIDDFLPRAHLKEWFKNYKISSSDQEKIKMFADKYIVEPVLVRAYVKHLELLELKKKKRAEKREATKQIQLESESSDESDEDEEVVTGILVESDSDGGSDDDTHAVPLRRSTRTTHTTYATRQFYGSYYAGLF